MTNITTRAALTTVTTAWVPKANTRFTDAQVAQTVLAFLDAASTSFGRATAYNDRATAQAAELASHEALLQLDRGLYALFLTLPGVTDRARQIGTKNLLGLRVDGEQWLAADVERRVLAHLVAELPAQRVFKTFLTLRVGDADTGVRKANNARTRKLILRVVLGAPKIELWAVKYRRKMAESLTHAWGRRLASILRSILGKDERTWSDKEVSIVRAAIDRFANDKAIAKVRACVAFVLGATRFTGGLELGMLKAYELAKVDLSAGRRLPLEVLEGIRSTFHKDVPKEKVLELTAATMTTTQKMQVQRRATEAKLDIAFDPKDHDAVRLYLYAFEMGMTREIAAALADKAFRAAAALPVRYGSIGILLDASASMAGSKEQAMRPMATALAMRDVLTNAATAKVITSGGERVTEDGLLVFPAGATALSEALLDLVTEAPDAIFVLSDGYENRPAGRFAEVVRALRKIGISIPIYHLNPVFAAEAKGVRTLAPSLSSEGVATMPVRDPNGLALSFYRGMLEAEPRRGIEALVSAALPQLAINT